MTDAAVATSAQQPRGLHWAVAWLAIAAATLVVFGAALGGSWLWDDHFFFHPPPPLLQSPRHVAEVFATDLFGASSLASAQHTYRPLTVWLWSVVVGLSGGAAWALHAWSLLLHAACGVALCELAVALGLRRGVATVAALAWLTSATQVEAAAWLSAVHGVAETLLVLVAARLALLGAGLRQAVGLAVCLGAALLCKESGILVAPVSLALLATRHGWRAARLPLAAMALVVAGYALLRWRIGLPTAALPWHTEGTLQLAAHAGRSLLWPVPPDICRPLTALGWQTAGGLAVLAATGWAAVVYAPQRPQTVALLSAAVVALGLYGPVAGQTALVSDRYLYLPLALWTVALALAWPERPAAAPPRAWRLAALAVGLVVAIRAVQAWQSVPSLRDDVAAFTASVEAQPGSGEAWYHLGMALVRVDRTDDALVALRESVRLQPRDPRVWSNLTGLLVRHGRMREALEWVAQFDREAPPSAKAAYNLALAARQQGDLGLAQRLLRQALHRDPQYAKARELAEALHRQGNRGQENRGQDKRGQEQHEP